MAWHPRTLTVAQKEERRLQAARLLRAGWTQAAVAVEVGASPAAVCGWAKRLEAGGVRALKARKHPGAPSRLSPAQWRELARVLKRGALAAGFPTERWTLTRVAHVVQQRFGVHYHPHYLAEPLHRLGFTPQRPPTQAKERDDALVEAWVRHDWEAVKKGLVEAGQPLSSWMRQVTRFGPASPPPGPPAPMHPSSNDATGGAR